MGGTSALRLSLPPWNQRENGRCVNVVYSSDICHHCRKRHIKIQQYLKSKTAYRQDNDMIMIFAMPEMESLKWSPECCCLWWKKKKKHLFKYQIIHFSWEFFWKEETGVYSGALQRPRSTLLDIALTQRTLEPIRTQFILHILLNDKQIRRF